VIRPYPKIFTIGQRYIEDIFDGEVVVEEKLDGSQFAFSNIDGEIHMRSKGAIQYRQNPDAMFRQAVDYVSGLDLPERIVFYCEYLRVPKHNTLRYDRIPKNHLMLFGISDVSGTTFCNKNSIQLWAERLDIEPVPCLFEGKIKSIDELMSYLETDSFLGGSKIEGVVAKNYEKAFLLGGQPIPFMAGKFVSEASKEVHRSQWKQENTGKGRWETFKEGFRTEARWQKAVQHLAEARKLEFAPRDIGALVKEIQRDILEEETDYIKDFLFKEYGHEVLKRAIAGFPDHYKKWLAERAFEEVA